MNISLRIILLGLLVAVAGCQQTVPKDALQLKQESLQDRQSQTRRFDTKDERKLLRAGAQVLQDLGYTLEESSTDVGVVVGSKDRDATEAGQVVGAVVMAAMFGVATPIDEKQKIRVSLVTKSAGKKATSLRVTFQRVVWNTKGEISKTEGLNDPKMYQDFFDKLSQSVFLTGHEI